MEKILIIDDENKLRSLMARILSVEGYEVAEAQNARSGLQILDSQEIGVVITDVKLPDANGVALCKQIKTKHPTVEVVVMTAYGTIADGVQAIKHGAFDYLTKGDDNEKIIPTVAKALEKMALQRRVKQLEQAAGLRYRFDDMVGHSKALLAAIDLAQKVARTDTTVLLLGETGTGKEVFAQAIHHAGQHHKQAFVAINCGALEKDILESELFGHLAGAFTGASKDKKGLFEEAHRGTIFLDEIGEMPLELQAKLLRVLETGTFIKVGDTKPTTVQVRVLAATNRDLQQASDAGQFRLDLFYRLSVFTIQLPALRERREDIIPLAMVFLKDFAAKINPKVKFLAPTFEEKIKQHHWKGNIRELRNVMERAVILADTDTLQADALPYAFDQTHEPDSSGFFELNALEKLHIGRVLKHTAGNKTEAARLLGIGLTTLYRKIEEYGL
jgi:two-component system, NtrC family, response regulator